MYKKYIKRLFDIFFAILLGLLLSPILLIIAILIKVSSEGPVLFLQERLGKDKEVFNICKFRTMVTNAEKSGDGLFVFSENDNRITKIGKFLRKTSLDELPQLLNVLKGEMSFIGPRPPVCYHPYKIDEYPEEFDPRFTVLPGITGLAQIKLRNGAVWDERMHVDNEYVANISCSKDISIFIKTITTIFKSENVVISDNHRKQLERRKEESDME
ncbi:sugar transferase [Enterococcus sp. CWB-B31]|uniref:sugar transferase n=1 Tax=Enterococcus sp. CWB-B31 TaxID=2885159 RepID=UPI001E479A61|nr:sugar transferase [Enterococcus sp. CWB-B31]MCB5954636.1 sugar transferase [Enterococcus sp. CWB-B31]